MKNMINTALVAVAVAIAMVATVDAKQMKQTPMQMKQKALAQQASAEAMRRQNTPKPMTKTERTKVANNNASEVSVAIEQVMEEPTTTTMEELNNVVSTAAITPEMEKTIALADRKVKLEAEINIIKDRIKAINYGGWFGYKDEDSKKAHSAAQDRLNDLEKQLKDVKADLKINEKETSASWTTTICSYAGTALLYGMALATAGSVGYVGYKKAMGQ